MFRREFIEKEKEHLPGISQKMLQNAQNTLFFFFFGIYAEKMTIHLPAKGPPASSSDPLGCAGVDMLTLAILSCSRLTSNAHLKAFSDSN